MMFVPSVYLDVALDVDGKVWGCEACYVAWVAARQEACWSCEQPGQTLLWVSIPPEVMALR